VRLVVLIFILICFGKVGFAEVSLSVCAGVKDYKSALLEMGEYYQTPLTDEAKEYFKTFDVMHGEGCAVAILKNSIEIRDRPISQINLKEAKVPRSEAREICAKYFPKKMIGNDRGYWIATKEKFVVHYSGRKCTIYLKF